MNEPRAMDEEPQPRVALATIAREWTRLGCIGFGGPPTHIALLRTLCVDERRWMDAREFEEAVAATNLLPGPASTQLAIYCAWRLRGTRGALLGGFCFIVPGLVIILALAAAVLARRPERWILGAARGSGAAVPAVALIAAWRLVAPSRARLGSERDELLRWFAYLVIGAATAAFAGQFLVLALLGCGVIEWSLHRPDLSSAHGLLVTSSTRVLGVASVSAVGGLAGLAWVSLKVGALSYGGGFVIIPLMQHDVVTTYHWMTAAQFLSAVALGQVTPGPVVQTVAVVGYAAAGVGGGLFAAAIAFAPSFLFVLGGGRHFARLRGNIAIQSFFTGAGAAVIGGIAGSAITLGLSLQFYWQVAILAGALAWLFVLRRGVVSALLMAGFVGMLLALSGVKV
jgi:chromate transporter